MDTTIVGRKRNERAAVDGETPDIHHIYVRGLTSATHGNATGIGIAELCHRRVTDSLDRDAMRMNCITAGHVSAAMLPIDFVSDREALATACQLAGYIPAAEVPALWIRDTLTLEEIECSEFFWEQAKATPGLEIVAPATPLEFDSGGDLIDRFSP